MTKNHQGNQESHPTTSSSPSEEREGGVVSPNEQPKRRPIWRRLLAWSVSILLGLLLLLFLLTGILLIPGVQTPLVNRILGTLEETTGLEMSVGRVRVGFPGRLLLEELLALDQQGDTVLHAGRLTAQTNLLAYLKHNELPLSGVSLTDALLDYHTPGDSLVLEGTIGRLTVSSASLDPSFTDIRIGQAEFADIRMAVVVLPKPPKPRTGSKPTPPTIRWDLATLQNVYGSFSSSLDSTLVEAVVHNGRVDGGLLDLPAATYSADRIELETDLYRVGAVIGMLPLPWHAEVIGEEMRYGGADDVAGEIQQIRFGTGDGWQVNHLSCRVHKDAERMNVEGLTAELPRSELKGAADLPFRRWIPDSVGRVAVDLSGRLTLPELSRFVPFLNRIPEKPIRAKVVAKGDWQEGVQGEIELEEPSLLRLKTSLRVRNILGGGRPSVSGEYDLETGPEIEAGVTELLDKQPAWRLPAGLALVGSGRYEPEEASADLRLTLEEGEVTAIASYRPGAKSYSANLVSRGLDLGAFLPGDSLGRIDVTVLARGSGTDPYSEQTAAALFVALDTLQHKDVGYHDLTLLAELQENHLFAALDSNNEGLRATSQLDLMLRRGDLNGSINLLVDTIIPDRLGIGAGPLQGASFHLDSYLRSDLDQFYDFIGTTSDLVLRMNSGELRPPKTTLTALSTDSLLRARVESGDLGVRFASGQGLREFGRRVKDLSEVVTTTLRDSAETLDMSQWIALYPNAELTIEVGRENPLRYYLERKRIGAQEIRLSLLTDPERGLRGEGMVQYFQTDTFRVDNIDLLLRQDSAFVYGVMTAHKERFRNQLPFDAILSFSSNVRHSEVGLDWQDHLDRHFVTLGAELTRLPSGDLVFGFTPTPIVLAYNTFVPKRENYLMIPHDGGKIIADIDLRSADGASISLTDIPSEENQVLHGVIRDLRLSSLVSIPMLPRLEGTLSAEVTHLQPTGQGKEASLVTTASLKDFYFEEKRLGSLSAEAEMRPEAEGQLLRVEVGLEEQPEVAKLTAFSPKEGEARFRLDVDRLPLDFINPFLPADYAVAAGDLSAHLANCRTGGLETIRTARIRPLEGELTFHGGEVQVPALNETYLIGDQSLPIQEDRLLFRRFSVGVNERKLLVDGSVGLQSPLPLDLMVTGADLHLLDSEETEATLLYGRINADVQLSLSGTASEPTVQGRLSILGNSDFTFRTPQNRLSSRAGYHDLVTFTDFSDTLFVAEQSHPDSITLGGMTLAMDLHIDPATRAHAILTPDEQLTVFVVGGGDFNVSMQPYSPIALTGSYEVRDGELKMSFPPIQRTFAFDDRSRVTWIGKLTNPTIDLTATAKISSRVTLPGEEPRSVDFDVSIIAEETPDHPQIRFETTAPKDFAMRNRLATLSPEEQTRQSIILLTTGYYIGNDPSGSSSEGGNSSVVNNALAGVLTSQVNSFLGESLHADINLGITNDRTEAGERTDYTYSIAKGFLDDRIRVVVGGRVMTGSAAVGMEQSFIDNMSMEYRLDRAGTHYLRLFHNKNYENFLEGEVIETGIGYVLRRRLDSPKDLFRFRSDRPVPPALDDLPTPQELVDENPQLRKPSIAIPVDSVRVEPNSREKKE